MGEIQDTDYLLIRLLIHLIAMLIRVVLRDKAWGAGAGSSREKSRGC